MTVDPLARRLPEGVSLKGVVYDEAHASTWREWLSTAEADCLASFGAESRRREFLAGRAVARSLLAERMGRAPASVPLRRAADEGVDVIDSDWRVSIAHSGGRAIAAAARQPVGVDLEEIQPRDPDVARFLLHPDERELLETLPYSSNEALILCWCLKEAVLKARRTGFRTSPKELRLRIDAERGRAHGAIQSDAWRLWFERLEGFWAVVALSAS